MKKFWITNLVLFQVSWLSAAFFTPYAVWLISLFLLLHFVLSPSRAHDLKLLLLVPIGLLADKLQLWLGIFTAGDQFFPPWLLLLWVMFILCLNHSLSWLDKRSVVTLVILGALGGSSSYWGGMKVGAIEPLMPTSITIATLMVVWGVLLPLFIRLKRQIFISEPSFG